MATSASDASGLLGLLRLHPWTAPLEVMGEGQGWQDDDGADEEPSRLDLSVEAPAEAWAPVPGEGELPFALFVDGVRRVEAGVVAWREGAPTWGLLGACAAGAVACSPARAEIVAARHDRALVVGLEECGEGALRVPAGSTTLEYRLTAAGGRDQEQVRFALLGLMQRLEAQVVAEAPLPAGAVTVVDGLVGFLPDRLLARGPLVGLVKEHRRLYAQGQAPFACLMSLRPGERTPVFLLDAPPLPRYSWYARTAPASPGSHPLEGVLRIETPAAVGLEAARCLAGVLTAALPRFSPPAAWDRRAPANLYPVAALEERLRRDLGDAAWVRRHIAAALSAAAESHNQGRD